MDEVVLLLLKRLCGKGHDRPEVEVAVEYEAVCNLLECCWTPGATVDRVDGRTLLLSGRDLGDLGDLLVANQGADGAASEIKRSSN